jgi:hypothetical protein
MNYKLIVAGALGGLLAAIAVDVNAWAKSDDKPFDWGLAVKRWIAGAMSGAAGAFGLGAL